MNDVIVEIQLRVRTNDDPKTVEEDFEQFIEMDFESGRYDTLTQRVVDAPVVTAWIKEQHP